MAVEQMTSQELYQSYTPDADPNDLMNEGRTELATRLQLNDGLNEKAAYYAADMILQYAERLIERKQNNTSA